jgi:hypothetical protein
MEDKQVEREKKICFVITPIGDEKDPIRRHVEGIIDAAIRPALEANYNVSVAHQLQNPGSINKQIIQLIYESDLAIANLTGKNPNVMYELAFRHCVGKPTIMIAEKGTILPFDVSAERTIFYVNDAKGALELKDELKKRANNIDFGDAAPSNPIYDNLKFIETDKRILKQVENDSHDSNVFKYILNRLDTLDKMQDAILKGEKGIATRTVTYISKIEGFNYDTEKELVNQIFEYPTAIENMSVSGIGFPGGSIEIEFLVEGNYIKGQLILYVSTMLKKLGLNLIDIPSLIDDE